MVCGGFFMIEVSHVSKDFIKYEKEKGLKGLLKGFFNAKKIVYKAVDDISFTIKEGEMVGYIGANGAGKSTTIKMLTGILTPTHGEIVVNGIVPSKDRQANAKTIGVVFGQRTQLWWDLPLIESFSVLKEIYQVSEEDFNQRMALFNEVLGLNEFIKSPVRTLSLGQRMRADIAASLLHNPKVLYLDEPTIGLDVSAKLAMRQAIKKMNETFNTTLILTTHDMDDIEDLCSRIMILDHGKIIYDGDLSKIKEKYGVLKTLNFSLSTPFEDLVSITREFAHDPDFSVESSDLNLVIKFNKHLTKVSEVTTWVMNHFQVLDMSMSDTDIEEIVASIYEAKVVNV
jgi:ABC-2 type transport system ATP-binding protein